MENKEQAIFTPSEIVLSRMYTGKYLSDNIGHEAINLFKADDGKHYIYLNDIGKFDKKHVNKDTGELLFDNIILTKPIGHNAVEVVGWASGLEMIYNPQKDEDNNKERQKDKAREIKYGGQTLEEIFRDSEQHDQDIVVTFSAKKVLMPEESICIVYAPKKSQENTFKFEAYYKRVVRLGFDGPKLGHDLKTYIIKPSENYEESDFKKIKDEIIDVKGLWIDKFKKVSTKEIEPPIFLEICRRNYEEIAYSNMIHHFLINYPELQEPFVEFLRKKNPSIPPTGSFEIYREYHPQSKKKTHDEFENESDKKKSSSPIDLLIKYGNYRIIIENKIKAEIGALKTDGDGNQLTRYVKELMEKEKINEKNIYCIILTPNYHKIDLEKLENEGNRLFLRKYKPITYKDLWDFFSIFKNKKVFSEITTYYDEFLSALKLHTGETDDFNSRTMMRRLGKRIKDIKEHK